MIQPKQNYNPKKSARKPLENQRSRDRDSNNCLESARSTEKDFQNQENIHYQDFDMGTLTLEESHNQLIFSKITDKTLNFGGKQGNSGDDHFLSSQQQEANTNLTRTTKIIPETSPVLTEGFSSPRPLLLPFESSIQNQKTLANPTKPNTSELSTQISLSQTSSIPQFHKMGRKKSKILETLFPKVAEDQKKAEALLEEISRLNKENLDLKEELQNLKEIFGVQTFPKLRKQKDSVEKLKGQVSYLRELAQQFQSKVIFQKS